MKKETKEEKRLKTLLGQKRTVFCQEYIKTNNGTQSAITAGYSPKTATSQASRLLMNVNIKAYIAAVQDRIQSDRIADIDEVMQYLTAVMRGEKKDQFDLDASLSDRTKAATELAKRLDVSQKAINLNAVVQIVDDIPDDPETEQDEE